MSHGGLAIDQDENGFYNGASLPVNDVLASIFLQLRISERSGRGVPKIIGRYGKNAIKIEKNRITVTIPFERLGVNEFVVSNKVSDKVSNKVSDKINKTQAKMIEMIRDNPNITISQFSTKLGLSEPAIKKNLKQLKASRHIKRIGSNKTGYWEVIE